MKLTRDKKARELRKELAPPSKMKTKRLVQTLSLRETQSSYKIESKFSMNSTRSNWKSTKVAQLLHHY